MGWFVSHGDILSTGKERLASRLAYSLWTKKHHRCCNFFLVIKLAFTRLLLSKARLLTFIQKRGEISEAVADILHHFSCKKNSFFTVFQQNMRDEYLITLSCFVLGLSAENPLRDVIGYCTVVDVCTRKRNDNVLSFYSVFFLILQCFCCVR